MNISKTEVQSNKQRLINLFLSGFGRLINGSKTVFNILIRLFPMVRKANKKKPLLQSNLASICMCKVPEFPFSAAKRFVKLFE